MQVENSPRLHRDGRNGAPAIDLTRFTEYSGNIPLNRARPLGFTHNVNGTAAGAGMSLALIGDLTLAVESAHFTMAYSRVGLTPDCAATYYLPRLVGFRRALELYLTNRVLSATEAEAWGLVNRVVTANALVSETQTLAVQLAAGPTQAIGATKQLFHNAWTESLESQMELETRAITNAARCPDAAEGLKAFFEKRKPNFRG
jgi:2-(1,2-epoxy-1,2-dihydrophenyl)acetyl-CoA isomerase